jgi:hypothetical protein
MCRDFDALIQLSTVVIALVLLAAIFVTPRLPIRGLRQEFVNALKLMTIVAVLIALLVLISVPAIH